jgi:hypothetical protein
MEVRLASGELAHAVLHSLVVQGILLPDVEYQIKFTCTKEGDGAEATTTFAVVIRPQPEETSR